MRPSLFRAVAKGVAPAALLVALVLAPSSGAASAGASVTGALTLDDFGNQLIVSAHTGASGQARGSIILESGLGQINGQSHQRIFIDVTCLEVSGNTAFVGGITTRSTPGVGSVAPAFGFVLEDAGANGTDRSTIFDAQPANPCGEIFGPAVNTAIRGNIQISDGTG